MVIFTGTVSLCFPFKPGKEDSMRIVESRGNEQNGDREHRTKIVKSPNRYPYQYQDGPLMTSLQKTQVEILDY